MFGLKKNEKYPHKYQDNDIVLFPSSMILLILKGKEG